MSQDDKIFLASASPRRAELLQQIGVDFDVLAVDIDESIQANESAEHYVQRLALEKAQAGYAAQVNIRPTLGSDTIVLIDNELLGKPENKQHAKQMLTSLSGRKHQVLTAVAMVDAKNHQCRISISDVYFRSLTADDIDAYWNTGEPCGKAGAYAIQGIGAQFIERLEGSYSGVMGLPLFETAQLLKTFGIATLSHE